MKPITQEPQWVEDCERTRSFDNKTVKITGHGVFLMHVKETDAAGNRRPGFAIIAIEPHDLDAALSVTPKDADK